MLHIKQVMNERIAFHTGHTPEEIERDSDRDRWFTAEDAKAYGIIDHVIRSASDVNAASALV
jgi:ATP-dependent Clp protease, protease subunit